MNEDTGYAPQKWAFDDEVTRVFDDMLARSIPAYAVMRSLCHDVASRFTKPGTALVDLGCSRGGAIAKVVEDERTSGVRCVGAEVSPPMVEAAKVRFASAIESGMVSIQEVDLRTSFPDVGGSPVTMVQAVLTLQFVPIEYRQRVIGDSYAALAPGGAMILVEKILGGSARTNEILVDSYYGFKMHNGYSRDEIDRKRFSLEGVLVPQTEAANIDMLKREGFRDVECFWRYLNFAAWLAVK